MHSPSHKRVASDCSTVVSLGATSGEAVGNYCISDDKFLSGSQNEPPKGPIIAQELVQLSDHGYAVQGQRDFFGNLSYHFDNSNIPLQDKGKVKVNQKVKRRGAYSLLAIFRAGFLAGKTFGFPLGTSERIPELHA